MRPIIHLEAVNNQQNRQKVLDRVSAYSIPFGHNIAPDIHRSAEGSRQNSEGEWHYCTYIAGQLADQGLSQQFLIF